MKELSRFFRWRVGTIEGICSLTLAGGVCWGMAYFEIVPMNSAQGETINLIFRLAGFIFFYASFWLLLTSGPEKSGG